MKTKPCFLLIVLALIAGVHQSAAQGARFFRIAGPTATTITTFRADGTLIWSNALPGTYTVQTATALPGGTNWVDYVQLPVTNSVNTNRLIDFNPPSDMALIPAGSFTMGDSFGDSAAVGLLGEVPLHIVYISAFYMDKYDVTKALWDDVYQWATNHGYSFGYDIAGGKALNHPEHDMSWYEAAKWCNARSEKEGRVPAYYTNAAQTTVYRSGAVDLDNSWVNWSSGYRLPTEAEWEKAARGGLSGQRFPWGNTISWSQANYRAAPSYYTFDVSPTSGWDPTFNDGVPPYTSPVGYFAPNGYGLYDMAGNVRQWCWDWYDYSWYSNAGATQSDTRGPAPSPNGVRILRGGSWGDPFDTAFDCRTAYRSGETPNDMRPEIGFRSVLPSAQ